MNTNSIVDALQWRYATKKFDTSKKLTPEQLDTITEALRLSASSFGLQPWKFIHVVEPSMRAKLRAAAWDQPQVTDASDFFVLAVRNDVNHAFVDAFIQSVATTRGIPVANLKEYADSIKGSLNSRTPEAVKEWSSRQVYIALGTGLAAAAVSGIDACPMEGFDTMKFDEILGLSTMNLESRVCFAVGFRSPEDATAQYAKVRFPKESVFVEVK